MGQALFNEENNNEAFHRENRTHCRFSMAIPVLRRSLAGAGGDGADVPLHLRSEIVDTGRARSCARWNDGNSDVAGAGAAPFRFEPFGPASGSGSRAGCGENTSFTGVL